MFDAPWGPGGLKASRAELGLSMDTELKSKSVWQISVHPLLQVIKIPARARAPHPVGAEPTGVVGSRLGHIP